MARLEREGTLEIRSEIPPDHSSWEGTDLRFSTPVSVSGKARWISSGEVVVRLSIRGSLDLECRRCLEPVQGSLELDVDLLFSPEGDWEEGGDGVRPLPDGASELDLTETIREEVILFQSPLAVCRPDCRGFCPRCGVNLNEEPCQCSGGEPDPRWDALRVLGQERE